MNISFDHKVYSTVNNGEVLELTQSPSKIKDMIEITGEYEFEDFELKSDPEISSYDHLHVRTYANNLLNELVFVFDKYGIHSVCYPTGHTLYKNESVALSQNPMLTDILIAYTHNMIEANGEKYANSVESFRKANIKILERQLAEQEESRVSTRNTKRLIDINKKVLSVVQAMIENSEEGEKQ